MSIPFTQYLRPDGRQVLAEIDMPTDVEDIANNFINLGGRFTAEVLTTGDVSFTAEYPWDIDNPLAHEIVPNGPEVVVAVERLIRTAYIMAMTQETGDA